MKRLISFVLVIAVVASPVCASAQDEESAVLLPEYEFDSVGEAMGFGLQRGAANLLLGWLELPRNLSYEFTKRPLSAIVTGPLMGATFTAMRVVFGTADVLSAGTLGYYGYATALPDYPWDGPWLADKAEMY